ncbi:MAG: acyltransferase [Alteromonadales bacterium]|nr:acyltransferase [Alteromonadales bacterium]
MRFYSLDALRGFAALAVVFFHLSPGWPGYLAVDLFFILSGFVLSFRYFDEEQHNSHQQTTLSQFVILRLARLWPLHAFTLFTILIVYLATNSMPNYGDGATLSFLSHFLLVQNTGILNHWLSWNEPSWSISVEFWVNLVVFAYIAKRGNTLLLLILSIVGYILLSTQYHHLDLHIHLLWGYVNTGLIHCFAGFFLGMVVYRVYRVIEAMPAPSWPPFVLKLVMTILEVGFLFACFYLMVHTEIRARTDFIAPLLFSVTILVFVFQYGWLSRLLRLTRLDYLGTLSFSIYLNHFWLLALYRTLHIPHYGYSSTVLLWVFGALIPISIFTYYLVEKPGQKWMIKGARRLKLLN